MWAILACDGNPLESELTDFAVLFTSNRQVNQDIYALDPVSLEVKPLTSTPWNEFGARWSPDGRRIVFYNHQDSVMMGQLRRPWEQVYVMDADGSNKRRLFAPDPQYGVPGFDWSPDGRQIALSAPEAGEFRIHIASPDGSSMTRITSGAGGDFQPRFSPDGRRIAFLSNRPEGNPWWKIYVMNADGSDRRLLPHPYSTDTRLTNIIELEWSPDGQRIAYLISQNARVTILTAAADGSPGFVEVTPDTSVTYSALSWSPPGDAITASGYRTLAERNYEIWRIGLAGGAMTNLTNHAAEDHISHWRRTR